jgi:hypothetical protein
MPAFLYDWLAGSQTHVHSFYNLNITQAVGQDDQPSLDLWGYMVILARIFGRIRDPNM